MTLGSEIRELESRLDCLRKILVERVLEFMRAEKMPVFPGSPNFFVYQKNTEISIYVDVFEFPQEAWTEERKSKLSVFVEGLGFRSVSVTDRAHTVLSWTRVCGRSCDGE